MSSAQLLLDQARERHRAGDLPAAERGYRQILQSEPDHAEALHLLGVLDFQRGRHEQALAELRRSLELAPANAVFHNNLGSVHQELRQWPEAAACYRAAIRLQPRSAALHNNLGSVLAATGDYAGAERCYREAVRLQPDYAQAFNNLGYVLAEQGRRDEAATVYRGAVRLAPDYAEAWNNLGNVLRELRRPDEAVPCFQQALRVQPQNPVIHNNLGNAFLDGERPDDAVTCYRQALRLQPGYARAYSNLGYALTLIGQPEEAAAACREALRLQPDYADALHNLGIALLALGQPEESLACTEEALRLNPELGEARLCRGLGRLLLGEWTQGWPEYEWRWLQRKMVRRHLAQPRWDGGPLAGRRILLWPEQGLGDTLQFVRYAPLVKQRGGFVIVQCQPPLVRLLSHCPGIDHLVAEGDLLPAFDVHLPLLSLPGVFHTTLATVPADVPYVFTEPGLVERWRQMLADVKGFRVGIAWQGNRQFPGDPLRSIPLRHFAPLAGIPGVQLVRVQHGPGSEQLDAVREAWRVLDVDRDNPEARRDMMDTAALMQNLDLVVTSDSAVAHLAGALGVPVWVALPLGADWRWLRHRSDNPWYPTMRLFRQRRLGDWDEVFLRIRAELKHLLTSGGR